MNPRAIVLGALLLSACRKQESRPQLAADPPVSTVDGIPAAPVSGKLHGAVFTARDARYVVDRRVGYEHTDLELSAGTAPSACAPPSPDRSASLWIRLDGPAPVETKDFRTGAGLGAPYSVHYQAHDGERWIGVGDGAALVSLHAPGPDGRLAGAIAVCFPDAEKSCVSGSFEAVACPSRLDQPVRGVPAIEREPTVQRAPHGAAATPSASASASASASSSAAHP